MDKSREVRTSLTKNLYALADMTLITSISLATILAYIDYNSFDHTTIRVWYGVMVAVTLVRLGISQAYKHTHIRLELPIERWTLAFRLGVLASGLAWGSAGILLFDPNQLKQSIFLIFMIAGLTAGGLMSYSADRVSAVLFNIPATLPMTCRLFGGPDSFSTAMGAATVLYMVFMLVSLRRINQGVQDNIILRIEAAAREDVIRLSEERYRLLLTHAPIGILHYNRDMVITYCNEQLASYLRNTTAHLVGVDMHKLRDQSTIPAMKAALDGKIGTYEGPYQATLTDAYGWISMICAPFLDAQGNLEGGIGIVQDISEHRRVLEALAQTNAELEQFAYVASHDLRQPLRVVSSYVSLLEQRLGPSLTDDLKSFMAFAVGGAKRMDKMILDLLEYSRTGKTTQREPVSIGAAIKDALDNLSVAVRDTHAEIEIAQSLPTVMATSNELMRLFQNIIGNALKYRDPNRTPKVSIGCRRDGGHWQISVQDNGIGIAPEYRDRAFQIFQRLVPKDAYEGTGIGLAICKKIVEHLGGKIWIESEPGAGTTFLMTFPAILD